MVNSTNQLRARVAALETQVDFLESELTHLHELLVRCGFPNGVATLKETVEEYLADEQEIHVRERRE